MTWSASDLVFALSARVKPYLVHFFSLVTPSLIFSNFVCAFAGSVCAGLCSFCPVASSFVDSVVIVNVLSCLTKDPNSPVCNCPQAVL